MEHSSNSNTDDRALRFDNQICYPLYASANAVVRAYRPLLEALDLTYLQYMVLMLLWENTRMSVKDLGARLLLDSGTLTPLLKRLEAKKLVTRTRGEQDERVRIITITPKGMALKARAGDVPKSLACSIGMSPEQGREIKKMCELLLGAIQSGEGNT